MTDTVIALALVILALGYLNLPRLAAVAAQAGLVRLARALARFCRHDRATRYWFQGHRFMRVCQRCSTVLETGRDVQHRYPDGVHGVERGKRAS